MAPRRQSRRTIDAASLEIEIARLGDLDLKALRLRWQGVTGRLAPVHLPKHLLLAMLAYRIQADAFGDLDVGDGADIEGCRWIRGIGCDHQTDRQARSAQPGARARRHLDPRMEWT